MASKHLTEDEIRYTVDVKTAAEQEAALREQGTTQPDDQTGGSRKKRDGSLQEPEEAVLRYQ